jgi:hypothetical protein
MTRAHARAEAYRVLNFETKAITAEHSLKRAKQVTSIIPIVFALAADPLP